MNETVVKLSCDSVFSLCKANGGVTAAAAYEWMSELYNHVPFRRDEDRIQIHSGENIDHGIFYWEDAYPDSHLFADGEYLRKKFNPDFMLYHTMAIDDKGHQKGSESLEYELSVLTAGILISAILPQWLSEGYHVVVTADHGMNHLGLHGGTEDAQRDTPLYIFSPKIAAGRYEDHYISQLNIAPLLCRLLGISVSAGMRKELEIKRRSVCLQNSDRQGEYEC
jgi:predicted AlkP superfamily pyrophosphatase or phosphodiesterase